MQSSQTATTPRRLTLHFLQKTNEKLWFQLFLFSVNAYTRILKIIKKHPFLLEQVDLVEENLDKYSIAVLELKNSNKIKLRAVLDLRNHKFRKGQRYGVVASFNEGYENRLAENAILLRDMKFGKGHPPHKVLDVGLKQYVIVCMMYSENEYLVDQQTWLDDKDNQLGEKLEAYITFNLVDMVIVKGANVPNLCKELNSRFQSAVGCRKITYANSPSHTDFQNHLLSVSNCALMYGPFQFETYQAGESTAGGENDCSGGSSLKIVEEDKTACATFCISDDSGTEQASCHLQEQDEKLVIHQVLHNYHHNEEDHANDCSISPDLNKEMAKTDTKLEVQLSRKRKFFESILPNYDDRQWTFADTFKDEWLVSIERDQPKLIPVKEFKDAKDWIEYLPNEAKPWFSRMRCKLCHLNVPTYGADKLIISPWATDEGELKNRLGGTHGNKQAIKDHAENPTHLKIIERKKEEQIVAAYDGISFIEQMDLLVTTQVMSTVYLAVKKMGASFASIEHLIQHMIDSGVAMGTNCGSRTTITNMVSSISNTMHNRFKKFLIEGTKPLTLIVDSSTDVSKKDILAILVRTLEDDVPVTYFYGFVQLSADGRAEAQTECILKRFLNDGTYEAIKRRIISFVSDGASVMVGKWKGMATLLRKEFGNKLVSVHCGNHRLELAFGHAMDEFDSFRRIEKQANKLYSFYSIANKKRYGKLMEFLEENQLEEFNIHYVFKVRWVDSHRAVIKKIYDHQSEIIGHLKEMISNEDKKRSPLAIKKKQQSSTAKKATSLLKFYSNKNVILTTTYQLDVQATFSKISKVFQNNDECIIGFAHAKSDIVENLHKLRDPSNGPETAKFLNTAICGGAPCGTMDNFEQSTRIQWKRITLEDLFVRGMCGYDDFPKLSEIYLEYLEKIEEYMQQYFPDVKIMHFDLLDNRDWDARNWTYQDMKTKMEGIMSVLQLRKPATILKELIGIMNIVKSRADWCVIKASKPTWFWSKILKDVDIQMSNDLKVIIEAALAIAISSSDAERIFSLMNYCKDKHRSCLSVPHTEDIVRMKKNGPDPRITKMDAYSIDFIQSHGRCDPIFDRHAKRKARKSNTCEEDEDGSTSASVFSSLFI